MRKLGLLGVVVCAFAFAALLPATAGAQTFCNGIFFGTSDNVFVFPGQTCTLYGANVTGNVIVMQGGAVVIDHSTIGLNVIATNPRFVYFSNGCFTNTCNFPIRNFVGQNVIVIGATSIPTPGPFTPTVPPGTRTNTVCSVEVGQNVKLLQNRTPFEVGDDGDVFGCFSPVNIHQNGIAIQNSGSLANAFPFGTFSVIWGFSVVIDQNLICVANNPPANGTFAFAGQNKIGECAF